MDKIAFPDLGIILTTEDVVILAEYPANKWIVKKNWFTFEGQHLHGWYLLQIGSEVVLPLNENTARGISVINPAAAEQCPQRLRPPMKPLCPYPDDPVPMHIKSELKQAFLSVPTIADRDALVELYHDLPDGKIVRVNSVDDEGEQYFTWNQRLHEWSRFSWAPTWVDI